MPSTSHPCTQNISIANHSLTAAAIDWMVYPGLFAGGIVDIMTSWCSFYTNTNPNYNNSQVIWPPLQAHLPLALKYLNSLPGTLTFLSLLKNLPLPVAGSIGNTTPLSSTFPVPLLGLTYFFSMWFCMWFRRDWSSPCAASTADWTLGMWLGNPFIIQFQYGVIFLLWFFLEINLHFES